MKIDYSIKVTRENIHAIKALSCVASISEDGQTVKLKPDATRGGIILHSGDWLVRFKNGLYQRFGSAAYDRLVTNPDSYNYQR